MARHGASGATLRRYWNNIVSMRKNAFCSEFWGDGLGAIQRLRVIKLAAKAWSVSTANKTPAAITSAIKRSGVSSFASFRRSILRRLLRVRFAWSKGRMAMNVLGGAMPRIAAADVAAIAFSQQS